MPILAILGIFVPILLVIGGPLGLLYWFWRRDLLQAADSGALGLNWGPPPLPGARQSGELSTAAKLDFIRSHKHSTDSGIYARRICGSGWKFYLLSGHHASEAVAGITATPTPCQIPGASIILELRASFQVVNRAEISTSTTIPGTGRPVHNLNSFFVPQNKIQYPVHYRQRDNHHDNERSRVKRVLINKGVHFNFGVPFSIPLQSNQFTMNFYQKLLPSPIFFERRQRFLPWRQHSWFVSLRQV
jgi:hypothetical protein